MLYKLNLTLTDADYVNFNFFQTFETPLGRKNILKCRILLAVGMALVAAIAVFARGWSQTSAIYVAICALLAAVFMVFLKRIMKTSLKKQLSQLRKSGKFHYTPQSEIEFYDDKFVEISENQPIEKSYDAIERVCVAGNRYIYMFTSSVGAYILPLSQVEKQLDKEEFLNFIRKKCPKVELYK